MRTTPGVTVNPSPNGTCKNPSVMYMLLFCGRSTSLPATRRGLPNAIPHLSELGLDSPVGGAGVRENPQSASHKSPWRRTSEEAHPANVASPPTTAIPEQLTICGRSHAGCSCSWLRADCVDGWGGVPRNKALPKLKRRALGSPGDWCCGDLGGMLVDCECTSSSECMPGSVWPKGGVRCNNPTAIALQCVGRRVACTRVLSPPCLPCTNCPTPTVRDSLPVSSTAALPPHMR
mmetsp:Transcript_7808/g.14781  ORF Transcript_7808/g.14781 Transcript_7808/m.14781 type:complete len:233 (-) Transcript_7808:104-802(-)